MNLADAQKFGKEYKDDKTGVILWMHPSLPMSYYSVLTFFRENGIDNSQVYPDTFGYAECCILAIESEREDLSLQAYLDMRVGKTMAERFELFGVLVDTAYQAIIGNAINATRVEEFPLELPPEIVGDKQAKKNGSSTTTKKKQTSSSK